MVHRFLCRISANHCYYMQNFFVVCTLGMSHYQKLETRIIIGPSIINNKKKTIYGPVCAESVNVNYQRKIGYNLAAMNKI